MEQQLDNTILRALEISSGYSKILQCHGFACCGSTHYWEVGKPSWVQGWIIDISVIYKQTEALLHVILPILTREKPAFKVALDPKMARSLQNGEFGYALLGKIITIYPIDTAQAVRLAHKLIKLTEGFTGPEIVTDRQLGNSVYARFGAGVPVVQYNNLGVGEEFIYNKKGCLTKDPFTIPFHLPDGEDWPFQEIASPETPKKETVLQDKYKPVALLKEDAKGSVKKSLYLEKLWRIKWCVIKEGKKNILSDSNERDISDRLRWQYDLQKDLYGIVPLPKVYDHFQENGDSYLVMEYIRGFALLRMAEALLADKLFLETNINIRLQLIDFALQAIDIVTKMHDKGYIHRDITPGNFLVDKKNMLWLIDLELAYNYRIQRPSPPFRLGTPGFMSPEQRATLTPTVQQDIFALGCLCLFLFTCLMPDKFAQQDPAELVSQIEFFTGSAQLADLLVATQADDPDIRPAMDSLKLGIEDFRHIQVSKNSRNDTIQKISVDREKLGMVIQKAIEGLASPVFVNLDSLWVSKSTQESNIRYAQDMSTTVYPHLYQGASGVVWLLSKASQLNFPLGLASIAYDKSVQYIMAHAAQLSPSSAGGLYFGNAGLATALTEMLRSKPSFDRNEGIQNIKHCLEIGEVQGLGMIRGLAGKGIALLRAMDILDKKFIQSILQPIVSEIITQQKNDGSWLTITDKNKRQVKATGFGFGVAGILCFLFDYLRHYNDSRAQSAAVQGIAWLMKQHSDKNGIPKWSINDYDKHSSTDLQTGSLGIILCLMKAYAALGYDECKQLAEGAILSFPVAPVSYNLTQLNGLVGVGEVCLEGEEIFRSGAWKERANWIAQFLLHHFHVEKNGTCYWLPDGSPFVTAGLMEGNSGIIHFLIRNYYPTKLNHPLLV